jgi:hypothetical protein
MLIVSLLLSVILLNHAGIINTSEETNVRPPIWIATALPNYIFFKEEELYHCYNTISKVDRASQNCTNLMTKAIEECLNSGSIAIKAGAYVCDLFVNKKLYIRGEGRAATTIHGTITLDPTLVLDTPACQHSVIQNLRLDGQNRISIGIKYESCIPSVPLITVRDVDIENYSERGISFINASDCLFENVVVGNCPIGIYYTTSHNFGRIKSCELLNYREIGVYTDAQIYLSDTVFSAIQISPDKADLVLDNAFGTIIGCWFENNKTAPYAPCIDMPSTSYRPLTIMSCFFANRGGVIIRVRSACNVSITGNFFSQQNNPGIGCCVHVVQGQVYWSNNEIDSAFSTTLAKSYDS